MNRRWLIVLIGLAVVFFLVSLVVFFSAKRSTRPFTPEIVSRLEDQKGEITEYMKCKLFYWNNNSSQMLPVYREIEIAPTRNELYHRFAGMLLAGAENAVIPVVADTQIRTIHFLPLKEMLVIDFTESTLTSFPPGTDTELEFIYFFVDNFCYNFPEIKRVKFLVGGNEAKTLTGHLDLEKPFFPDYSYIKDE